MKKSSLFVGIIVAVVLGLLVTLGGAFLAWHFIFRVTPESALSGFGKKLETINSAEFTISRSYATDSVYIDEETEHSFKSDFTLSQVARDDYKNKLAYISLDASVVINEETETLKAEVYIDDDTFYAKTDDETEFAKNTLGNVSQVLYEDENGLEKYFQETWLGTFYGTVKDNSSKLNYITKEDHNGVSAYRYESTDKDIIEQVISEELSEISSDEESEVSAKLTLWVGTNGMPLEIHVEVSSEKDLGEGQYLKSSFIFSLKVSNINKTNVTIPEGVK